MNRLKALVVCATLTLCAQALEARPLAVDDYDRFFDLHDVQISADGSWIAYVVGTNDRAADEQRSAIWLVSWDGTQHVPVSASLKQAHAPRWSPDGRTLAFLGSASDSGTPQIMLLDRPSGQIRTLSNVTGDIGDFAWAPDGKRLVFVMDTGAEPTKEGAPPQPIIIDATYFKEDVLGYFENGERLHLYFANIATGRIDALTADPQYNDDLPAWSPDGSKIAFIRTHERTADVDGMSDIEIVDATAGAQAAKLARIYSPNVQRLSWSPDGRVLAFLQGQEPKYNAYMQDLLEVIPAGGGAIRPLSDSLDRAISAYAFADANSLLVTIEDDMTVYPARIDLKSGSITRLYSAPSVMD